MGTAGGQPLGGQPDPALSAEWQAPVWVSPHPRPQLTLIDREWPSTCTHWQSGPCPVLVRGWAFLEPPEDPLTGYQSGNSKVLSHFMEETQVANWVLLTQ